MTTGEKLAKLRKQNNYTQEQLAELLGVSRQAISKWESDSAYPETEKLIKLSRLYDCSLDYLLKDEAQSERTAEPQPAAPTINISLNNLVYERKSSRTIRGVPLWHVNIGAGRCAKGIIAVGFAARGVVACGLFAAGLVSFGVLSVGLLALGCFALGLLCFGSVSVGAIAFGGVAIGLFAVGGYAVGQFAVGGAATGGIAAMGDSAVADVAAFGKTEAHGGLFDVLGDFTGDDCSYGLLMIEQKTPAWLGWARSLFLFLCGLA